MKRNWMAAALAAALMLTLAACGDDEPAEGEEALPPEPAMYNIDGIEVEAMQVDDATASSERHPDIYTYPELDLPGAAAELYAKQLLENGFSVVDTELIRTDEPDFTQPEGEVRLAKKAEFPEEETEDGAEAPAEQETADGEAAEAPPPSPQVVLIQLAWAEHTCTVTTELAEGSVKNRPQEETPGAMVAPSMTSQELEDFVKEMPASVFGLEGTNMSEYHIYVSGATVQVDDWQCLQVNVYAQDEEAGGTNQIAGSYFMTPDGARLYRHNQEDDSITELEVPSQNG